MNELEKICEVTFIKAGGPGGQHRNKRETGVRLFHPPSNITLCAVERRSQARNLEVAYERLIEKLNILNIPKVIRKDTKISYSKKMKRLDNKKMQSKKKSLRRKPVGDY